MAGGPNWTGVNRSVYEMEGIFNYRDALQSTQGMYRKYIETEPNFSKFRALLEKADMTRMLDETGLLYTVFIPVDEAFESSGYPQAYLDGLTKSEAIKLVNFHIVRDSRVFSDGVVETVHTLSGLRLRMSGRWDTFRIYTVRDRMIRVIDEKSNMQASNGVLHATDKVLDDR